MAETNGTPSAPEQAAEKKSGNVSGTQVEQLLLKREVAALQAAGSAANVVQAPAKSEPKETAVSTAPSEETPKADQPEAAQEVSGAETPAAHEPDEVLSHLSPEQRERIDKRIAKEVAKRKDLEGEVARLRGLVQSGTAQAQPAVATAPVIEPSPDDPLAGILDINKVIEHKKGVEDAKYWAQSQLDIIEETGLKEIQADGKTFTRADLKAVVRNSDRALTKFIPERAAFIQQRAQFDRQVAETFPWVSDRASPEYQAYQQILGDKDMAKRPNAAYLAAVFVEGQKVLANRAKSSGQPAAAAAGASAKQRAPASQVGGGAGGTGIPSRDVASASRAVKELQDEMGKMKGKRGVTGRDVEAYLRKVEATR